MTRTGWFLGLFLALAVTAGTALGQPGDSSVKVSEITVDAKKDTTIQIRMTGAAKYRANLMDSPTRLVIDLSDTSYVWRKTPLNVGGDLVTQIRGSQYRQDTARVVIQFSRKPDYKITESPNGLTITVSAPAATAAKAVAEPAAATPDAAKATAAKAAVATATSVTGKPEVVKAEAPKPAVASAKAAAQKPAAKKPAAPPKPVPVAPNEDIAETEAVAMAQATEPPAPAPTPAAPATDGSRLISFDFKDADVVNLLRILAAESGRNIVIGDDVKGKMSITLRNVPWQVALETILESRGLQKIERDNLLRIVSNEQLTRERETAARLEEAKLKAEADVRQKLAEAKKAEQAVAAAELARHEAEARGPLREETLRLSYADPVDVAATLQGILGIPPSGMEASPLTPSSAPPPIAEPPFSALYGTGPPPPPRPASSPSAEVLSRGITIQAHKPTNSIFIRHYTSDLERIKKLIRETLDIPLPQVKIEARLEALDRSALEAIGVSWGGAAAGKSGHYQLVGEGVTTTITPGGAITPPASGIPGGSIVGDHGRAGLLSQLLPVSAVTGLPTGGSLINLPLSALTSGALFNAPTAGFSFGIIGTDFNVNLALQALAEQQKTRTLARPEVVTVENAKATIQLGREIPYATVSSAGTQIQFRDAVLQLQVTPVVIIEGDVKKVKMTLLVENNEQGKDTAAGPTIIKRRAETQVLVKEGEHLVVGGVGTSTDQKTIRKVPIFGDIPVLGWLFKQRGDSETTSELVVFITPTVLGAAAPKK
jgi:type IV pilus assembly protein PilQ